MARTQVFETCNQGSYPCTCTNERNKEVYIVVADEVEEGWGPFESIHHAAEWAHEHLSTWWWVMKVNNILGE